MSDICRKTKSSYLRFVAGARSLLKLGTCWKASCWKRKTLLDFVSQPVFARDKLRMFLWHQRQEPSPLASSAIPGTCFRRAKATTLLTTSKTTLQSSPGERCLVKQCAKIYAISSLRYENLSNFSYFLRLTDSQYLYYSNRVTKPKI